MRILPLDDDIIHIRARSLKSLRMNTGIVIIGTRGSGKTTVIKWIVYYNYRVIRYPYLVSGTAGIEGTFRGQIPDSMIFGSYDSESLGMLIADQVALMERIRDGRCPQNVKKTSMFIMDSVGCSDKKWRNDTNFKKIIYMGRFLNMTSIMSVQRHMNIRAEHRENLDYVIIMGFTGERQMRSFYREYWNRGFGDFKLFKSIVEAIFSENHNFMILDNYAVKRGECKRVEDYVFGGRCPDPKYIPPNRWACHRDILKYHKKHYDPAWAARSILPVKTPIKVVLTN